jgi:hypothetical protein
MQNKIAPRLGITDPVLHSFLEVPVQHTTLIKPATTSFLGCHCLFPYNVNLNVTVLAYDMIYLTAIGLTAGGSSAVHI